jgi:beta-mannosidase
VGIDLKTLSLNGAWFYLEDAQQKLQYDEAVSLFNGKKIKKEMKLPTNWELAGLNNFDGAVWFIRKVKIDAKQNGNKLSVLSFLGADYFTEAWVNGIKLGSHEGYFQPFNFTLTNILEYDKENLIVVKVASPREIPELVWPLKKQLIKGIFNHHDCRPGGWSYEHGQDKNTGGVWNDIELHYNGKVFIEQIKIKPVLIYDGAIARTHFTIKHINIFESEQTDSISVNINLGGKKILLQNVEVKFTPAKGELTFAVDIEKPKLWYSWDLGAQNIYDVEIKSELFNLQKTIFGIKEVKLDEDKNFYINGKKLFLRGTNIIPTQFLSTFSKDKIKKLVTLIKEANINAVRVHAHVNRPELYDEFDKAGIIVWQDFALQWTYEESNEFVANAVSQIKDMVNLLHNHPSIAFWCCHNEPGEQIQAVDPFLYDAVLSEDNTRIIRKASNYEEHPYDGWYWGKTEHYAAAPMGPLVTEFGAQGLPAVDSLNKFLSPKALKNYDWKEWEYHDFQYDQTFNIAEIDRGKNIKEFVNNSQSYQADLLKTAINFYRQKKHNGITGIFQFMFVDCWPSITWSIVDYYGKKKTAFEVLKSAYNPVYLSVNLRQKNYLTRTKLNVDFYIINDTYKKYKNCSVLFKHNDNVIGEVTKLCLKEDDIIFEFWEKINVPLPDYFKSGKYIIDVELVDKIMNKVLSSDKLNIEIRDKK